MLLVNADGQNLNRLTMHYQAQRLREQQQQMLDKEQLEQVQAQRPWMGGMEEIYTAPITEFISQSNHEISGIQDWYDLEDIECASAYKNEFEIESGFTVTRSAVIELYESQISQLYENPNTQRNVFVKSNVVQGALKQGHPTIFERFCFKDGASSATNFLKSILAQYKRRQWDRNILDYRLVLPVIDRNMVIFEELRSELVPGYQEREALCKRFIFRANGCVYIYTSSVPDEIHADDESGRDDASRYTLVFQIMCIRRLGNNDLVLERIKQVDFRQVHSQTMFDQFLSQLHVKALYWQQDLQEHVAQLNLQ